MSWYPEFSKLRSYAVTVVRKLQFIGQLNGFKALPASNVLFGVRCQSHQHRRRTMNLGFFGQSNGQSTKRRKNPPERVIKVPHTQLESGIWSRDGRYGKQYSFSISGRNGEELFRTFGPEHLPDIALTVYVLSRHFSQGSDGVSKKVQAGLADLADRLESLFGATSSKSKDDNGVVVPYGNPKLNGHAEAAEDFATFI